MSGISVSAIDGGRGTKEIRGNAGHWSSSGLNFSGGGAATDGSASLRSNSTGRLSSDRGNGLCFGHRTDGCGNGNSLSYDSLRATVVGSVGIGAVDGGCRADDL